MGPVACDARLALSNRTVSSCSSPSRYDQACGPGSESPNGVAPVKMLLARLPKISDVENRIDHGWRVARRHLPRVDTIRLKHRREAVYGGEIDIGSRHHVQK